MIKIIPPNSWDWDEPQSYQIKVASSGINGDDLRSLVKRAGNELASWVKQQSPPRDEVWVHGIAMSAHESGGMNRNFDAWSAANLERDHPTFVKYAKAYRHHRASDPTKSYGIVKRSWFNPDMKRVELIVAYNADKKAAERNEGLIADEEIEKIASGEDLAWSMSASVPYDVCSICGNKAKSRSQYCDESSCLRMGMKKYAGRVYEDGKVQYVDNPVSKFKDISYVRRGADRTAFVLGKVASVNHPITGAELAELVGLHDDSDDFFPVRSSSAVIKIAEDLSDQANNEDISRWSYAFDPSVYVFEKLSSDSDDDRTRSLKLRALADIGVVLPVGPWLELITGLNHETITKTAEAVSESLNFIYAPKLENLNRLVERNKLTNASVPQSIRKWASSFEAMSLDRFSTQQRLYRSSFNCKTPRLRTKNASAESTDIVCELANNYIAYTINVLKECQGKSGFDLSPGFAVVQNRIC